ncbi:RNA polymerase sigma factor [Kribbella deserti]|uniref:RNA polymerase sigma factor n=1 Tax=Kribbella deserti TaxID=1926257 RepID=A0ABV6QEW7_9ACTN
MSEATAETRFAELAHIVGEPLRRYVVRRAPSADVDDVMADVFLVLWRRLDDVPHDTPLPWSYGVARGCLANARRSTQRQLRLVERIARSEPPPLAEPSADHEDLLAALRRLKELDREVVTLWAWEGLAPREIAEVTGLTANAVSIRLHKARRQLASSLGKNDSPAGQNQGKRRPR